MKARAAKLEDHDLNGIKLVLVRPYTSDGEAILEVQLHNTKWMSEVLDPDGQLTFVINGGDRVPAGKEAGQVKVVKLQGDLSDTILQLTVSPIGDYSVYTLVLEDVHPVGERRIDPVFSRKEFKFRPGCFNTDCLQKQGSDRGPVEEPPIDYLAKDYQSFRHAIIAAMMERVPGWKPTSEASLDVMLLELFSAAADELSDFQDRVLNEAYLSSARKRVSLARHARLMDYHVHQGNQASTMLVLKVAKECCLSNDLLVWSGEKYEDSSAAVFVGSPSNNYWFSLGLDLMTELDAQVTTSLSAKLKENGTVFVSGPIVSVQTRGREWLVSGKISDGGSSGKTVRKDLLIVKEGGELKVYSIHLQCPLLNEVRLYTWGDVSPGLGSGSMSADLLVGNGDEASACIVQDLIRTGNVTQLVVQERLNPSTGREAGHDPNKRQLLDLLPGDEGATADKDPFTNTWFVRVRWKNKLTSSYLFKLVSGDGVQASIDGISLFHGNLLKVAHGRPRTVRFEELIGEPEEGKCYIERIVSSDRNRGSIVRLPEEPLAYRETVSGGEVPPVSTLNVTVIDPGGGEEQWAERITLVHSTERDTHFIVETDEDGASILRFGNGVNGKELPEGSEVVCRYQTGTGPDGNIGADKLTSFEAGEPIGLMSCWNPFQITNGKAQERPDDIIRRVPEAYRSRQLRAVTLQDYVDRAKELEGVQNATARYAWTGSWRTVRITIDPEGETTLDDDLVRGIETHLDAVRLIGEDLEVRPPRYLSLDIKVTLCVDNDFWPGDIRDILDQEFSVGLTPNGEKAFFHPDRWTFGQTLTASQILGRIHSIKGVDHVLQLKIRRWGTRSQRSADHITPGYDEIIRVENDPDHMENGSIAFELLGGRK